MSSQYFGPKGPNVPHLVRGQGGLQGEIVDLRADTDEAFEALENGGGLFRSDEWIDPPAADDDYFLAAEATQAAAVTLRASKSDFLQTSIPTGPRGIIITRSAAVGSYTTDPIIVKGKAYGEPVTLTFTPADADGGDVIQSDEDLGLDELISVEFPAQVDASGAFDVGFNAELVLFRAIDDLAGVADPIREVSGGAVVTTGSFSGRKYTPAAAPNGTNDYGVMYVGDPAS